MQPSDHVVGGMAAMIETGMAVPGDFVGMRREWTKPAGERCQHQRHSKGCAIYAERPFGCRTWNCRWVVNDDTADLRRPDRSRYVIDVMPDYVTWIDGNTGKRSEVPVVVIWLDPDFPDAHRDPALRAYLDRRAAEGMAALVRLGATKGFTLIAPRMAEDHQWHEVHSPRDAALEPEHSVADIVAALGPMRIGMQR